MPVGEPNICVCKRGTLLPSDSGVGVTMPPAPNANGLSVVDPGKSTIGLIKFIFVGQTED
jgi:hypothetical protein